MNLQAEQADNSIGRSRGALSTKIYHAVDCKGRLLVLWAPARHLRPWLGCLADRVGDRDQRSRFIPA